MMGLCLHPKFGGWFAIRGCLIFKNISGSGLPRREPTNILAVPADQLNALELFNLHWRDSRFRDVIPVEEKYSLDQQLYFNSPPGRRKEILDKIRQKYSSMRL
jgi:cyanocobalamin reductase (cyanide-eliminating) / alkylcobalamin dealkylase